MKRFFLIIISIIAISAPLCAQHSGLSYSERLDKAKDLCYRGMYAAAERELDVLITALKDNPSLIYSEAKATKILCAIALGRADAEGLVANFESEFPADPQLAMIKFNLASDRFDKGFFETALPIYESINEKNLYKTSKTEFFFKRAYCNMIVGNMDRALEGFKSAADAPVSPYTYPSKYYMGYIKYGNKSFEEAFNLFMEACKDIRFVAPASYYATECRFMSNDYEYVIANGPSQYDRLDSDRKANLARMVSESYYKKNKPADAKYHLDIFLNSGKALTRKDMYFAGAVLYSLNDYSGAVSHFSNVVGKEDGIGQSAYYFCANSYLNLKNKIAAMNAFKAASESDFDSVIKEDAYFNFAKLSFDVNSDISAFDKYVEIYPSSGKVDEINTYMSVSYLLQNDYESAIAVMQKISNPSREVLSNLQKAKYFRSLELIGNGGYQSAIPGLQYAAEQPYNKEIASLAEYWLAECYYKNNDFSESARIQEKLLRDRNFAKTDEYDGLIFSYAFNKFKLGDFSKAAEMFSKYINKNGGSGLLDKDARERLGDSYFMQSLYSKAEEEYEAVFTKYQDDDLYAEYQCSMACGLQGKDGKKISILKEAIAGREGNVLYPKALYELGRTYLKTGANTSATSSFNKLLASSDSLYYSKALLELAMLSSNDENYKKAIDYYERIVREMPLSEEVQDALAGLESIYQMQNRPEEYLRYLDRVGLSNIKSAGEKEQMVFSSAEQIYLSGNTHAAINSLQSFLDDYPKGVNVPLANYYLAECLKQTGRNDAAAEAYYKAMVNGEGDYADAAALNYADISYNLGYYDRAITAYETLFENTANETRKQEATIGKMQACFKAKQYDNSLKESEKVLAMTGLSENTVRQAKYIKAKSFVVKGNREQAMPIFKELSDNVFDEVGAESAYMLILNYYETGDFANVENRVYALSDSGTPHVYWLAKSFIVLGDSFADREEWKQAQATFQSILDGYQPSGANDDVVDQVKMRLDKLKSMVK
ncbi:MAG: tetratricopeptide repeat protein [Bacteroidales bacterium]|nr:tetratricopeptide repeat protein [Bacteroidales bacterium]